MFHQLRTVELYSGHSQNSACSWCFYITALTQRNDSSIYGVQLIMQSSVEGPVHIDWRVEVESLLKSFESKLSEISDEEFKLPFLKRNVTALIDMKLGKPKELEGGISVLLARDSKWNTEIQPMGLNVWTGCGTKVASEAGVNRFLRGIHQDWSSTEEIVEHKSIWESAFERKGKR
ncbi:unnamed protein product [Brassica oleracea]